MGGGAKDADADGGHVALDGYSCGDHRGCVFEVVSEIS